MRKRRKVARSSEHRAKLRLTNRNSNRTAHRSSQLFGIKGRKHRRALVHALVVVRDKTLEMQTTTTTTTITTNNKIALVRILVNKEATTTVLKVQEVAGEPSRSLSTCSCVQHVLTEFRLLSVPLEDEIAEANNGA